MDGSETSFPSRRTGSSGCSTFTRSETDPKPGTSWNLVSTQDLDSVRGPGSLASHGGEDDADFNAYTGSVVVRRVRHPPPVLHRPEPEPPRSRGPPLQLVMHATSRDGMADLDKHPELPSAPRSATNPQTGVIPSSSTTTAGVWRMLLAARHAQGPSRRRGVIAHCVSSDLEIGNRPTRSSIRAGTSRTNARTSFAWGDWWYLVYSEFSESFTTRYRMAKSPGRSLASCRFATRRWPRLLCIEVGRAGRTAVLLRLDREQEGQPMTRAWQWAGTMSVLETRQNADGTLAFSFADEQVESFWDDIAVGLGSVPSCALHLPTGTPPSCPMSTLGSSTPGRNWRSGRYDGVRLAPSFERGRRRVIHSSARTEPESHGVRPMAPKPDGDMQWHVSGDVPFEVELERPCDLIPGLHTLEVVVDGDLLSPSSTGRSPQHPNLRPSGRSIRCVRR